MKRFNQLSLIVLTAFSTMLVACEDPLDNPTNPDSEPQSVQVEGLLHAFSPDQIYNNPDELDPVIAQFRANGQVQLDALDPDWMEVRHSHIAVLSENGDIDFQNGEFYFEGSNDDSLFGTYEGSGKKLEVGFDAEFLLTIKGGTGKYAEATGRIREIIKLQAGNSNKVYDIYFGGDISLPGGVQLTRIYM